MPDRSENENLGSTQAEETKRYYSSIQYWAPSPSGGAARQILCRARRLGMGTAGLWTGLGVVVCARGLNVLPISASLPLGGRGTLYAAGEHSASNSDSGPPSMPRCTNGLCSSVCLSIISSADVAVASNVWPSKHSTYTPLYK